MITDELFQDYMNKRYIDSISYYDTQAERNKRLYTLFQWSVIVISAVLPVLVVSAAKEDYKWATVALSLLLAIGTSSLKAFKFQENWLNYRQVAEALKQEQYFYQSEIGPYSSVSDKRALLVERVESLIARQNANWMDLQQKKEESSNSHSTS